DYFNDRFSVQIKVAGRNPTVIEAQKCLTLSEGILYVLGLLSSAYLERAYIKRFDRSTNKPVYITVKIDTSSNYLQMDEIPILQGDEVRILSNLTFAQNKTVSISGAVREPSVMEFWEGITVKDLILMAGGFT